jgi:hypothetical protein
MPSFCYGGAKLADINLASTIRAVDEGSSNGCRLEAKRFLVRCKARLLGPVHTLRPFLGMLDKGRVAMTDIQKMNL